MNYKIISLASDDVPEIYSLVTQSYKEDFPEFSPEVANIYATKFHNEKHFRDFLKHDINHIFGARDNNTLVAFIVLKGDFGGVVFIDFFIVKKDYRNRHIGTKLLHQAELWALEHAYHYLWLFTESEKNINYYKQNGFRYVGVHKKSWFGVDEHIMGKQLRNEPFPEVFTNYSKYF
jgi:GNAT superfamily N-acetyltransferase